MTRSIPRWLLLLLPFACVLPAVAEPAPAKAVHRVVMQLTSADPQSWSAVLDNIEGVRKALGEETTEIELVAHGPGIGLLLKTDTKEAARIEALAKQHVVFAACEVTMKRKKLTRDDLLPGVSVVPAGVAEVVLKQEAGWSYVKAGF